MSKLSLTPRPSTAPPAVTLAERFWSIARGMDLDVDHAEPVDVVRHVLRVLDALERGDVGSGLTKNTVSFLVLLRQHEMMGDLLYAAPEQARGEGIDERSLVFSVGVLLFEKLTGRHPFGAEGNARRMARIRKGELGSGVSYFPKLPAGLRNILVGAMGPFPEDRWASLAEMRGKLEGFVREETSPGPRKRARSNPPPVPARPRGRLGSELESTLVRPHTVQVADDLWGEKTDPSGPGFPLVDDAPRTESSVVLKMAPLPAPPRQASILPLPLPAPPQAGVSAAEGRRFFVPDPSPRLVSEPPLPRRRGWGVPVACSLLGAAAASIVCLVILPRAHRHAPAVAARAPAPAPAPEPAAPVLAYKVDRSPAPAASPPPATSPTATAFDPMIAGSRMLELSRACIAPARLHRGVSFGVGVLFGAVDGLSRKLYYAADSGLDAPERRCLGTALIGLASGAPPARSTIVEYRFKGLTESAGAASFIPEKPARKPKPAEPTP